MLKYEVIFFDIDLHDSELDFWLSISKTWELLGNRTPPRRCILKGVKGSVMRVFLCQYMSKKSQIKARFECIICLIAFSQWGSVPELPSQTCDNIVDKQKYGKN